MQSWERWWETLCVSAAKRFSTSGCHTSRLHGQTLHTASKTYNVQWLLIDTIANTKHTLQTWRTVTLSQPQRTTTKNNKQVRQQACKMQIPPYRLTQCRRPQFRMPTDPRSRRRQMICWTRLRCRCYQVHGRHARQMATYFPEVMPPCDSPQAKVHQKGRRPVRIVGQRACKISCP